MSNCADCRYWNRNGRGPDGSCAELPQPNGFDDEDETGFRVHQGTKRRCLAILHDNGEELAPSQAVLTDGSGYAAALWTEPAFGCSLFEAGGTP